MRSERKKQVMTLSILVVAVLVISIGFAAFSARLRVNSSATVTPNASDFKVVFSSSENAFEINPVKASPSNMGDDATITNTPVPTISGLMAKTSAPGDSVTYTFYVRNEGKFEAFLNSVSYGGKICAPGDGTNVEMANKACDSINATVSVGSVTTSETKTDITGESLKPGESKQVTVTLSYDSNGARANGPFAVQFGDISMYYATVNGMNEDPSEIAYTGIIYRNSEEELYIGDDIKYRWCAVVPGVANSCVQNEYFNQIFKSGTECEATLEGIANSGQLDATMEYLLANAVCEQETKPLSYETNLSNISQNNYLKHEVINNKVTASYACITYTENGTRKDVCVRGLDTSYYASNQATLRSVESHFKTLPYGSGTGYCNFDDSNSYCYSDSLTLHAHSYGYVYASGGSLYCNVYSDGYSECH